MPDGFPTRSRHFLGPPQREPASARKLRAIRSDDGHYAEGLRKRKGENGKEFKEYEEYKEFKEFKKEPATRIQNPGVRRSGVGHGVGTIVSRVDCVSKLARPTTRWAMQRARMAQIRRDYDMGGSDRNPRRDLRPTARCVREHAPA